MVVVAASVHDHTIGTALLDRVAAAAPSIRKAWVDAGFTNTVVAHGAGLGIDVEVVGRAAGTRGFTPLSQRRRVEQAFGTLMLHRRLARDYETRPASTTAMIHWSMVDVMTRRLTGTTTPTWRDPPA